MRCRVQFVDVCGLCSAAYVVASTPTTTYAQQKNKKTAARGCQSFYWTLLVSQCRLLVPTHSAASQVTCTSPTSTIVHVTVSCVESFQWSSAFSDGWQSVHVSETHWTSRVTHFSDTQKCEKRGSRGMCRNFEWVGGGGVYCPSFEYQITHNTVASVAFSCRIWANLLTTCRLFADRQKMHQIQFSLVLHFVRLVRAYSAPSSCLSLTYQWQGDFVLVHIRWYLVSTIIDVRAGPRGMAEASSPDPV